MRLASDIAVRGAVLAFAALALTVSCHGDDPCGPARPPCKSEGRCVLEGKSCVAKEDASCATSDTCTDEGRCKAREGHCAALSSADCEKSTACTRSGRCKAVDGFCIAGSKQDCEKKQECRKGLCEVQGGACVVVRSEAYDPDNKEGGCPCGCDHSEAMASDLEKAAPNVARTTIQEALRVIAEREDAGYITPAMVDHRRRLLASSEALLGLIPLDRGVPLPPGPALPSTALELQRGGLRVRAELMVHGETTERVDGQDKRIRASFRLGLEIGNASQTPRLLTPPTLRGDAGYPVSGWYVLGSDGKPWDGVLDAGQTRQVNVVGYLDRPLSPGSLASTRVDLEELTFSLQSLARAHWR